jgi:uncharacterized protein YdeI (YjbR/CyaY-like superfamily)
MSTTSEAIDAYIAESADFARPILARLRELVHTACPEVEESLKWSSPAFDHHGLLAVMGAFKEHVAFGFWKGKLLDDPHGILDDGGFGGSGNLKLAAVDDIPDEEIFVDYLRRAMELNEQGVQLPKTSKKEKDALEVPDDLDAALDENPAARAIFDGFSWSNQKEYVEWITGAKREATRTKRLAQAIEWMAEGKSRNWKYQKK